MIVSRDLKFLALKEAEAILQEISEIARMLNALRARVGRTT